MHNLEFVIENEKAKHLWNFEIETVNLISARQWDVVIVNKKKKNKRKLADVFGLCCSGWPHGKTEG